MVSGPRKSICGLINQTKKKAYLVYTSNTLGFLFKHTQSLQVGKHDNKDLQADRNELEFKVLLGFDHSTGNVLGRYNLNEVVEYYRKEGYTFYNEPNVVNLTPKVLIENITHHHRFEVMLYLVNERYDKFLVRKCKTVHKAHEYIDSHSVLDLAREAFIKE